MRSSQKATIPPNQQADATYSGTPTSGVPVTVLATTANVRIISIACVPAFTGGTSHGAEIHVLVDGELITFDVAPTTATPYFAGRAADLVAINQTLSTTDNSIYNAFLLEGRSVGITFELTTDGTPGVCTVRVKYAKW